MVFLASQKLHYTFDSRGLQRSSYGIYSFVYDVERYQSDKHRASSKCCFKSWRIRKDRRWLGSKDIWREHGVLRVSFIVGCISRFIILFFRLNIELHFPHPNHFFKTDFPYFDVFWFTIIAWSVTRIQSPSYQTKWSKHLIPHIIFSIKAVCFLS